MTPDTAARAHDEDDLLILDAFLVTKGAPGWHALHAAAFLATHWFSTGTNRFYGRADLHVIAKEIAARKAQIDAETDESEAA
jgi:hypothetical protein